MTVLTINLKDDPEIVETYRRYHRSVWPEVQESLRRFGVERMDIHLLGRRLVMIVEMRDGLDYRNAFKAHAASSPRVAQWEHLMQSLQEPPPEAAPGEWWAVMEPVFHLDGGEQNAGLSKHQEPPLAHVADQAPTS
jgi:L-rhamnose mutarotase